MRVRMKDIAKSLGVSTSTVSRALKNDPLISQEVRNKVSEIARKSNYTKRRSGSKNIYYLIDKNYFLLTSNFYNSLIEVIERETLQQGYKFHFNTIDDGDFSMSSLDLDNVAGIIMTSSYIEKIIMRFSASRIPIVLMDSYLPLEDISAVITDNIDGILKAMHYLYSRGHTRIGYMSGIVKDDIDCVDRLTGYTRALELFHIPFDRSLVVESDLSMSGAYEAFRNFLNRTKELPTAIIGVNDIVAIGALNAIRDFGLHVPADMSVIGFDDISLSNEVTPRLTTIHVDKEKMGRLSVARLIDLIKEKPVSFHKMMINPTIVERDSVRSLPGAKGEEVIHGM